MPPHVRLHNQIQFRYALNDSWYASADNMKFIKHDLKKELVMPLKANRKVALSKASQSRTDHTYQAFLFSYQAFLFLRPN